MAAYVHKSVSAHVETLLVHSDAVCEVLVLHLKTLNVVLAAVYRPPRCPCESFRCVLDKIRTLLNSLPAPSPVVIITGDFNFPSIDWAREHCVVVHE